LDDPYSQYRAISIIIREVSTGADTGKKDKEQEGQAIDNTQYSTGGGERKLPPFIVYIRIG